MDYWLGDQELFPAETTEWSTEQLWRMPRPFIAWQPPTGLPEAGVEVTDAPQGAIRFGSFNNNRKLSDRTLALWGEILQRLPEARLVLKANAGDDQPTQELLARRMRRQGVDPERVEWLALTPGCSEHLLQYRHLDIALDPVPNGGCTTTCEALWMGVPVVAMAGQGMVGRLAASLLVHGGCGDWLARDDDALCGSCSREGGGRAGMPGAAANADAAVGGGGKPSIRHHGTNSQKYSVRTYIDTA